MTSEFNRLDSLSINTIRTLSIDAIQKADSGHPGLPLGAAPMAYVLWQRHLKHNPLDPQWVDRDRFVLSAGHGCMLHYALLHLTGYPLSLDDIKAFRQWGSKTPGHPEFRHTSGVEATTGPLGQGHANAVGMAIAERMLAHRFNRPGHTLVDHGTWALISDGDVMEGVACEAASLAGHLKLGKLVCLYDANDVTLDGPAHMSFTEDVARRYESYGWNVLQVANGDTDLDALDAAIVKAKSQQERPTLIIVKTTIGFGSPNKAGTSSSHGSPLGTEEVLKTKKALGWAWEEPFYIPDDALKHLRHAQEAGQGRQNQWKQQFLDYKKAYPDLAAEFERVMSGELPTGWDSEVPVFKAGESIATRQSAGKVLNALAQKLPELVGGDADLGGSTMTVLKDGGSFQGQTGSGRNLHFGVREHAMGSIANGMAYHGGVRPFTATFFAFSDYMRPSVRLAALNHLPAIYVWTHDSIGLGEDGPTHQPVEQLAALRCMPNLWTFRPGDANEAAEAWKVAIQRKDGPTALVLTRQKVPTWDRTQLGAASLVAKGAYILSEAQGGKPEVLLLSTGSEVQLALTAQKQLLEKGVLARVVSMPCWEAFAATDAAYKEQVLPSSVGARVAIEAAATFGWHRWVGDRGIVIGLDRYGASAPADVLMSRFGITAEAVVEASLRLVRPA